MHSQHRQSVSVDKRFLTRCCIQFSSALDPRNMQSEILACGAFITHHAQKYPNEIVRSLVWRVVTAQVGADRLGAWMLLNSVLKLSETTPVVEQNLTDHLADFLPRLIRYAWEGHVFAQAMAPPAEWQKSEEMARVAKEAVFSGGSNIVSGYRAICSEWKGFWCDDVYRRLVASICAAAKAQPPTQEKSKDLLHCPTTFEDALWKMRRRNPRPSTVRDVFYAFGGEAGTVPTTRAMVESIEAIHPKLRAWLLRAVEEKCCMRCDTWHHAEDHCPCSEQYIQNRPLVPRPVAQRYLIKCKLDNQAPQVLDEVVRRMTRAVSFDELIAAFDSLRGRKTTSAERHALFLLSTYGLLPSRTVFDAENSKRIDSRLRRHFLEYRRHREYEVLEKALETLRLGFVVVDVADTVSDAIRDVKDSHDYFFAYFDEKVGASMDQARCLPALRILERFVASLCRKCLSPHHMDTHCPETRLVMPWDIAIASEVLERYELKGLHWPDDQSKLEDEKDRLRQEEKNSDLQQLVIAEKLLFSQPPIPYCARCKIYGHGSKKCIKSAEKTLSKCNMDLITVQLFPSKLERRLNELLDDARAEEDFDEKEKKEKEAKFLQEALDIIQATNPYPLSYGMAINAVEDEGLPLPVFRYTPEDVEKLLRSRGMTYLLPHAQVIRQRDFPKVCLYCGQCVHETQNCQLCDPDVRDFFAELSKEELNIVDLLPEPRSAAAKSYVLSEVQRQNRLQTSYETLKVQLRKHFIDMREHMQSHETAGRRYNLGMGDGARLSQLVDVPSTPDGYGSLNGTKGPSTNGFGTSAIDGANGAEDGFGPITTGSPSSLELLSSGDTTIVRPHYIPTTPGEGSNEPNNNNNNDVTVVSEGNEGLEELISELRQVDPACDVLNVILGSGTSDAEAPLSGSEARGSQHNALASAVRKRARAVSTQEDAKLLLSLLSSSEGGVSDDAAQLLSQAQSLLQSERPLGEDLNESNGLEDAEAPPQKQPRIEVV